jgi:hypothetical protein
LDEEFPVGVKWERVFATDWHSAWVRSCPNEEELISVGLTAAWILIQSGYDLKILM